MTKPESIPLTTSELGYLWTCYSINEMSSWFLTVFGEHARDEEVKKLYRRALQNAKKIIEDRKKFLSEEGFSIPLGFSEMDININSSSLYSDRFLLAYLHVGVQYGLVFHTRSLALSSRADIRDASKESLHSSIILNDKVVETLLNKGLYWRTPSLPQQTAPEKIQKESYLSGWFGDTRPMNSIELANHYFIIDILLMIEALLIGFIQIISSEEIIDLIQKGIDTISEQINELAEFLKENHLPVPQSLSAEVLDCKEKIFSERIVVTHIAGLMGTLLSQYGYSLGTIMKHDLVKSYSAQITKTGTYTEKVTRYLIEKEWLDKVPGLREQQ